MAGSNSLSRSENSLEVAVQIQRVVTILIPIFLYFVLLFPILLNVALVFKVPFGFVVHILIHFISRFYAPRFVKFCNDNNSAYKVCVT